MTIAQQKQTNPIVQQILAIGMVGIGTTVGGIASIIGLWLWLDYQTQPDASFLGQFAAQSAYLLPVATQQFLAEQARVMGLPLAGETPAYWYMARVGGIIAYLMIWLSTVWGLLLSTKVAKEYVPAPIAYGLHEFLSLGAVLFTIIHSFVLLGDQYIKFNIFHLAIPFTAPYQPFWTGLGTISFYLMVAITGSFYVKKWIGQKMWRTLHYLTFLVFALALGHGIMSGTDTQYLSTQLMYAGTGLTVLFLTFYRLLTMKGKKRRSN